MLLEYFQMIDRVEAVDLKKGTLRARSVVPAQSPVFEGHFPGMADAMQKMGRGLVHPVIDTEVSFSDIDRALERMESRQIFGKIILKMD